MSLKRIKELVKGGETRVNERGSTVTSIFTMTLDRYYFDFKLCTAEHGFEQFDTEQDASYFGVWVNRKERVTVTYAEGDVTLVVCASEGGFKKEISAMEEFYGPVPRMARAISSDGSVTDYYDNRISAKEL